MCPSVTSSVHVMGELSSLSVSPLPEGLTPGLPVFFARHLVLSWPQFQSPDVLLSADLSLFWSTPSTLNLADLRLGPLWVICLSPSHKVTRSTLCLGLILWFDLKTKDAKKDYVGRELPSYTSPQQVKSFQTRRKRTRHFLALPPHVGLCRRLQAHFFSPDVVEQSVWMAMSSDEQVQWVKDAKKDAAKRNHESALRATAVTKRAVVKGIFEAQKDVDWDDELVEKIVGMIMVEK
ncbi:hypothetical protein HDU79_010092 [Rhizoclosmatium sp. JEL0117]|nr:hypothetical protein HDU79_010092 [Rhizoclosmatium sp. JEL0117]